MPSCNAILLAQQLPAIEAVTIISKRVNAPHTPAEPTPDLQPEIAHLLLLDMVGYSKLLVEEQVELAARVDRNRPDDGMLPECGSETANSSEFQWAMEWRWFSSQVRKNRRGARLRLAEPCKIIRAFSCGWEFTAVRSTESPMLTTKRT